MYYVLIVLHRTLDMRPVLHARANSTMSLPSSATFERYTITSKVLIDSFTQRLAGFSNVFLACLIVMFGFTSHARLFFGRITESVRHLELLKRR